MAWPSIAHEERTESAQGRREHKKLETRRALEHAALRLFAEQGYDHTTVHDICEAAGVAVRTFFRYFASKQDLLIGGGDRRRRAEAFKAALAARPAAEPPLEAVRHALHAAVREALLDDPADRELRLLRLRIVEREPALFARELEEYASFEEFVVNAIARRTGTDPRTDLYPGLAAAVTISTLRVVVFAWLRGGGTGDLHELVDRAFDHLAAGLPGPSRG